MKKQQSKKTKVNYIDNDKFLAELMDYLGKCKLAKAESRDDPPIPSYIGECFLKIAQNLSRASNFIGYSYRDEMIMDGVENCLMYFKNFDPSKSKNPPNPFSYFTQITYFAFIRRIGKEKKQSYIKYKITEQSGIDGELEAAETEDGHMRPNEMLYENMAEYIQNFEDKVEEKRAKRKKSKDALPEENADQ